MREWPKRLIGRDYIKRAPTEADHEESPGAAAASRGFYAASSVWGSPTRGSYYNLAPRRVLRVTVQCKILEHAILYRVELDASDTVA